MSRWLHADCCRALLVAALALIVNHPAHADGGTGASADAKRFMDAYHVAFDTGHASEITAMYDKPLYMLAPNGNVRQYETAKDIRLTVKKWKKYMIHSGFDHTVVRELNVKSMSEGTALASATFDRFNTSGQVYQRGAATYTLRKIDGQWKIFLIHIHQPEDVIAFN